jgi:hypothetical protein
MPDVNVVFSTALCLVISGIVATLPPRSKRLTSAALMIVMAEPSGGGRVATRE